MDNESEKTIRLGFMLITITGCLVALLSFTYHITTTIKYVEHGYTRKSIPGVLGAQWVKE